MELNGIAAGCQRLFLSATTRFPPNHSEIPTLRYPSALYEQFYTSYTRSSLWFYFGLLNNEIKMDDLALSTGKKRKGIEDSDDALLTPKKARIRCALIHVV